MSLNGKLDAARQIVREHLHNLGVERNKVNEQVDTFTSHLTHQLGATTEAALEHITAADITDPILPPLVVRRVVQALGGSGCSDGETKQIIVMDSDPVALRLKVPELVAQYDPTEPDNAYAARLKEISGGKKFLVFNEDGTVDVKSSTINLESLRRKYPERNSVVVNGVVHQLYAVGSRPAQYADEHPLFPGYLLYQDGFSVQNVEWGTLPLNIKQLLFLAVRDSKEIYMTKKTERDVFNAVVGKDFDEIGQYYGGAMLRYRELEGGNQLPSLKVVLK